MQKNPPELLTGMSNFHYMSKKTSKENKKPIVDHLILNTSEVQVSVGCFSEHGEPG